MQRTLQGTFFAAFIVFIAIAIGTAIAIAAALDTPLTHHNLHPELLQPPTASEPVQSGELRLDAPATIPARA